MARDRLAPQKPGSAAKKQKLFGQKARRVANFAMIQPTRNASVSTAALRQISEDTPQGKKRRRRVAQIDRSWQQQAFDMADKIGELGYLLNLQANVVALCAFPVRKWDEEKVGWIANDPDADHFDARPNSVMEAFVGPAGTQSELIRRGAYNIFAAGETNLLGTAPEESDGLLWEFLSVEELYVTAEGTYVRRRSGLTEGVESLPEDNFTARCWRSSARFSDQADSEVKRVLPICHEIVALTAMVDATVKSRLSANMLFIPDGLDFSGSDDPESGDGAGDADDIVEQLIDHMNTPVDDPGSLARLIPLVVRGDPALGEKIKVIELARQLDTWAQELRQEALGRLAQGLDTPPEIMRGMAAANHWSSAVIDDSFLVKHIQPVGQLLADFLTMAYLRPMLEAYEGMTPEESAQWRIEFDPSPVSARADEGKSARDLADYLSDEAIIEANGFTKADMVTDEQRRDRRLWQLLLANPQAFMSFLNEIKGLEHLKIPESPAPVAPVAPVAPAAPAADPQASDGPLPAGEAPPNPSKVDTTKPGKTDVTKDLVDKTSGMDPPQKQKMAVLAERLHVAADAAFKHGIERAAGRVISKAQGGDVLKDRLRGTSKFKVMSMIAPDDLARLSLTRQALTAGMFDQFAAEAHSWVTTMLEDQGMDRIDASSRAGQVVERLSQELAEFANSTLLDNHRRLPTGLHLPARFVDALIESLSLVEVS